MSGDSKAGRIDHPVAKVAGALLSIAALVWLGLEVRSRWGAIDRSAFDDRSILLGLGCAVVLGFAYFLQALNWRDLVRFAADEPSLPSRPVIGAAMRAQVAKYLPGNVAHLAARHLWLAAQGVSHRALGKALGAEIVTLMAGAGMVAAVAIALSGDPLSLAGVPLVPLAWAALVAVGGAGVLAMRRWPRRAALGGLVLARAMSWVAILGIAFWLLLDAVQPVPVGSAIAAAAIGWAVGFATPGSPGGIGTREGAMGLVLAPAVPMEALLPILALFRLVTVGADAIAWGAGRLVSRAGFEPATY